VHVALAAGAAARSFEGVVGVAVVGGVVVAAAAAAAVAVSLAVEAEAADLGLRGLGGRVVRRCWGRRG